MNRYYLKGNRSGRFFVLGSGFTASTQAGASKLTQAQVDAAKGLGFEPSTVVAVPNAVSFAVCYVRKSDLNGTRVNANSRNPSERRFATFGEAKIHGSRFDTRVKNAGDSAGSAGHVGFYIVQTNDPVNAAINPSTGLTNAI